MEKRYGKLAGIVPLDVVSSLRNRAEKVLDDSIHSISRKWTKRIFTAFTDNPF